jgi:hypothetical protein
MGTFGEELLQPLHRLRDRIRPRDAERIETVLARGRRERLAELRRVAQKSRLA